MPPTLLIDLDGIDLNRVVFDVAEIEATNPHRYEMRLLDGIVHFDGKVDSPVVGFKDTHADEFWVRGHIPGRPLFPGVLMVEAAAQLASFCAKRIQGEERFIGFGGIENVRFRQQVLPDQRLYLLGQMVEVRPRRFKFQTQGVVEGKLAFEALIIGMPM